ncbi:MAG: hypothetical protein M5R36_28990 [Deltaproteobacteria bacterium]|nr:hypothetical protein [Deltaproteobacteria bacterium]
MNLFDKVFGQSLDGGEDEEDNLRLTNDTLIVEGASVGAITSLLVNTFDPRPAAVIAFTGGGAFWEVLAQGGAWWAKAARNPSYSTPYTPDESLDCWELADYYAGDDDTGDDDDTTDDDDTADDDTYSDLDVQACRVGLYLDPLVFESQMADIFLLAGAQDEAFPVAGFDATYRELSSLVTVDTYLAADVDHFEWFLTSDASPFSFARRMTTKRLPIRRR